MPRFCAQVDLNFYPAEPGRLDERPFPDPGDDGVLIQFSHTEKPVSNNVYKIKNENQTIVRITPTVQEQYYGSGIITEVGNNVTYFKPGDRVAVNRYLPCLSCENCQTGGLCSQQFDMKPNAYRIKYGIPVCTKVLANYCYRLPDHVSVDEAELLEHVSAGISACQRGGVTFGTKVLIIGAQESALMALVVAKAMGCGQCIVAGKTELDLDLATKLGADFTVKLQNDDKLALYETAKIIWNLLGDHPQSSLVYLVDEGSLQLAMEVTAPGGVVAVAEWDENNDSTIPIRSATACEKDIRGVFNKYENYPLAVDWVSNGKVDIKKYMSICSPPKKIKKFSCSFKGDCGGEIISVSNSFNLYHNKK